MRNSRACSLFVVLIITSVVSTAQDRVEITRTELADKIKGGWAAQTIGVTYGGPTEFRFNGTMIADYVPIHWYDGMPAETFENRPGLYDDIYMDLTFVDVIEKEGLDAPASAFADAFAHADYSLWHANQMARYNILNGVDPPESGHWLHNPEAEDIDFQIEADFAGLMAPGMPNAAAEMCDKVGHIMNSGDGYYGGVYVAAMYALAFVYENVEDVVVDALNIIPQESTFYKTISDVIYWYRMYPDDWKQTWFEIEKKWTQDVACVEGVFRPFNIDAKVNAAYVVLGLLYGEEDFGKTLEISTRAGQDSDCNPATAGGILGTMIGYGAIPEYWKQGLADIEAIDFKYTTISLDDVYELSLEHALQQVERNGGLVEGNRVSLPVQRPIAVPLEQNYVGHYPVDWMELPRGVQDSVSFSFDGIGFLVSGAARSTDGGSYVLRAEVVIDGEVVETTTLPTDHITRKFVPFWRFQMDPGVHEVTIRLLDPAPEAYLDLDRVTFYSNEPHYETH